MDRRADDHARALEPILKRLAGEGLPPFGRSCWCSQRARNNWPQSPSRRVRAGPGVGVDQAGHARDLLWEICDWLLHLCVARGPAAVAGREE